ncbi:MAG TPA: protein kinase [Vicinamibacterales bacterium]
MGRYQILTPIGAGGMGEVYSANDTDLKRQVALKVLPNAVASDADRLARLQREAEVLASLNHPNIAHIYGLERADGVLALVMEFVDGATLADRIADGPLPPGETLAIARQIADALEAAHERGVVHRDLKPANVKIRPDGTVKLLDFGLAKTMEGTATSGRPVADLTQSPTLASPAFTQAGIILGTAAYMSPEQAKGKPADTRTDIWAFGVVLVEMTTGRRPFEGETISDTIAAILTREPDLAAVPPSLQRLVRLCLTKDPRARLRHIGDALTLVDNQPSITTANRPQRRLGVWAAVTALAAAVAVAGLVPSLLLRPRAVIEPVTRFYVDAPPGGAFNYTYTASAISPDGRQMVFRVATANEAPALWLRPLDSLTGKRMAGTDGGDFPFWSPDGRSIAFFAAGKLKRVDVSSDAPIVICDASDADSTLTSGSWNRDGVILFGASQGLYRVSASASTPMLIAPVNSAAGETGFGSPQFLPDGDRFLMFVRSEDRKRAGYYVSSLSHPDQRTLVLPTRTKAIFVGNDTSTASSELLYLQDRTLLARRIDQRTLSFTGDPVPIASDIARFPPGFHASFWSSSSGNLIAYRTEASDKPRLTWIGSDGKRQSASGTEDFYTHVRVSRDGTHAALELADAGNMDVWTWDFARRVKIRQTFDPAPDRAPTWAPDNHDIAFSSRRTGVWQIFRKNVNSGEPEQQLTTTPEDKILPEWSRDGRYIVFIQIGTTTTEDIWALPLDGDGQPFPVVQTPAIDTNPALSPDGKWLAFESSQSGKPEVYVTRFPESRNAVTAAAPRWAVSTQGGSRPRWSADGRALFYVSLDESSIMRADVRLGVAGLESDAPRMFAEVPVMPVARSPFDVAADGRILLLERTINQSAPLAVITNWRTLIADR